MAFGREITGELAAAEQREWLVTNGIGGFASGTVAGTLTRRYHGLLVAALKPPLGRTLLVAQVDETLHYAGREYPLATHRWASGAVAPEGYQSLESFRLEGTTPVWTYALGGARLEKRVWMQPGANTTYVQYALPPAPARQAASVELSVRVLVNYRDYHATTRGGDWRMRIEEAESGLRVTPYDGATPFYLRSAAARAAAEHVWYRDFDLSAERYRGLDDREDHLLAGTFRAKVTPGQRVALVFSTDAGAGLDSRRAYDTRMAAERALLEKAAAAQPALAGAPGWVRHLVLAADQFIVRRPLADDPEALSVIAGYPWFGDWGRDTMIALPGLTLSTGRPEVAGNILRTFARFVDGGMLPNVFPDAGSAPEYNTVDAALWYFEALRQYVAATRDLELLGELHPVLEEMIDHHVRGTRYRIHTDPADGLLYAGEPGVQLTWMDAKVGDRVVTPRTGKPVEINALWVNALAAMVRFSRLIGRPAATYEFLLQRARQGFRRFWNEPRGCCFDVLDGPEGNDATLRPNQIFAVSLPESPLEPGQQRAVVDLCARRLLTPCGLRSLDPDDPAYTGRYGGGPQQRDAAYHQGTVWAWLLGPFVTAHLRVYGDPAAAAALLEPMAPHLLTHGLGSVSEIFDGDPPFTPRGCIAQAWSVAEVFRAWLGTARA